MEGSSLDSPVGCYGRVTSNGAIRAGQVGEVMISLHGGVEAYTARDVDGGSIDAYEEIVVVGVEPPRTVVVTRLYEEDQDEAPKATEHP
jgi:hypothetical protein